MSLGRGRVIRAHELAGRASPLESPAVTNARSEVPLGRRLPRRVVEAADEALRILEAARHSAQQLNEAARRAAEDTRLKAEVEGRAEGVAALAAKAIALARLEARADERELDRSVALSRILAERVLGEAIELDPSRINALARQILREARGARRVRILAHPEDAAVLSTDAESLGIGFDVVEVVIDEERPRASLRVETEIGILDGDLAPQLDRLCEKLRESLSQ